MSQISFFEGDPEKKKAVYGMLGVKSNGRLNREDYDFYATDPIAIKELMKIEKLNHRIWEPACGQGHLCKPLIEAGYDVRCTDLVDRGFGEGGIDFLWTFDDWDGDIITNPPYKYAEDFIKHALEIISKGNKVCMFLKIQFLEGKGRQTLFRNHPPKTIWVSSSRIKCGMNGNFEGCSSMMALAWFVWEKGYQGDTVVKWFN